MSSDLTQARTALAALLDGVVTRVRAVPDIPETFTPPICVVLPGVPYRQAGQSFADKRLRLVVVCMGGKTTNQSALESTEQLAEAVADRIETSTQFMLDPQSEMDQPRMYPTAQGQQALGIAVNVIGRSTRG